MHHGSTYTLKNCKYKSYNIKLLHWNFSSCHSLHVGERRNMILFMLGDSAVYAMGRSCVYKEKWFFFIIYATESTNGQIEESILQEWNERSFHMPIYLYSHHTSDHTLPFAVSRPVFCAGQITSHFIYIYKNSTADSTAQLLLASSLTPSSLTQHKGNF